MIKNEADYIQFNLTAQIIGACIQVHKKLGPGYMETIYQRALSKELWKQQLSHAREQWLDIHYDGVEIGKKRVDFLIEGVIVELKAKAELVDQDFIQTLSYLKASHYELALLINFGASRIQIKRLINQGTRSTNKYGSPSDH